MGFEAPRMIVPIADERELLLRFLQRKREQVVATAAGLTDEQASWTPAGRLLPIAGVINHLTHVEWRWIDGRYLEHEFPPREEEFRDRRRLAGGCRSTRTGSGRSGPRKSSAPRPTSMSRAWAARATCRPRTCCSGSPSRSTFGGRSCT